MEVRRLFGGYLRSLVFDDGVFRRLPCKRLFNILVLRRISSYDGSGFLHNGDAVSIHYPVRQTIDRVHIRAQEMSDMLFDDIHSGIGVGDIVQFFHSAFNSNILGYDDDNYAYQ